ncbi:MAG: tetraacyldisaccharide 4'-kinase [Alphaproteobacteria bacterium]|nr:tetraacyldisaccharide 4'-kinase [Alphaproteobacteria bacterium]
MRAPDFWAADGLVPLVLSPLGRLYGFAGSICRALATPLRLPVPVVCVGNLTAGGTGKTPVALAIGHYLRARGLAVHFLTRGYGGRLEGPIRVEPGRHGAREVGDEPLLLAAVAPTWVARDRAAGGRAAVAAGAEIVVMDDGLQNPALVQDLKIVVVDGGVGFGNARLMPAGPLREPLGPGLARADAVVLIVDPEKEGIVPPAAAEPPWHVARFKPNAAAAALTKRRVVAFAGIGRPAKFFATLAALGAHVVGAHAFPDHHPYAPEEIVALTDIANAANALLVTTAKDAVRLEASLKTLITVVEGALEFEQGAALEQLLAPMIATATR